MHDAGAAPSDWIVRWSHLVPAGARVLDVACGSGRHMRWFAQRGCAALGVDKDPAAIAAAARWGQTLCADIEASAWPLAGRVFDAVVVTNYLWRALLPVIVHSVAPGGVLLYETFAAGNERLGHPARADFLLRPGELLEACTGLHVLAYENGVLQHPARCVQRIAALRAAAQPQTLALQAALVP